MKSVHTSVLEIAYETGWFDEDEFVATAESFSHPDWVAITLNAYRARWVHGEKIDSHYDSLQRRLCEVERLSTPTLMIQGGSDYCDDPKESEGLERFFPEDMTGSCSKVLATSLTGKARSRSRKR